MNPTVEQLLDSQEETFKEIQDVCSKYRKDGGEKKNLRYLETRLEKLNICWEKFVKNHLLIVEAEVEADNQYFVDDIYIKTKGMYEKTLEDILLRKTILTTKPNQQSSTSAEGSGPKPRFKFEDDDFQIPPQKTEKNKEKEQELLREQYCNFRALGRFMEKIDLTLPMEKWELEDNLTIIKTKWEQIEKKHWELDYILQDDETSYKLKYAQMESMYDFLRREINHKIWDNAHYEKATPKIVIPDFYGNYNQWLTFKDLYIESVHNNPLLSKAQKMQHLKTKLKGEAEKLVQHLGVSADNYTSCWDIITHRYDNKRLLFTSYMNTLLNQPPIHQANAANIRKLHDVMQECLNGLSNIGLDITTWGPIIVHLLVQKLDSDTYNGYMKDLKEPRELPDLVEFTKYLESKFMTLEGLQTGNQQRATFPNKHQSMHKSSYNMPSSRNNYYKSYNATKATNFYKQQNTSKPYMATERKCPICKDEHVLWQCQKFLDMNVKARHDVVRNQQLCINCLYCHGEKHCLSRKKCKLCYKAHHTLMHDTGNETSTSRHASHQQSTSTQHAVNNLTNEEKEVLLTTVQLKVKTVEGDYINLRGLLDQGSQVSLITENAAQRLRLPRQKLSAIVSGVGAVSGSCKGSMNLECKSIHSDFTFRLETLIMNKLISNLPSTTFSVENWHYLENLKLADPNFNISGPIDLLLGADIYSELLMSGVMKSDNDCPTAQQTRVGWILCGNVKTYNCHVTLNDLENMARFWETEDITENLTLPNETDYCEKHYIETTKRQPDGRYVVQMPMKPDYENNLGPTKPQSQAQFFQLEQKMRKNKEFETEYKRFMNEYILMGHMKPITTKTKSQEQVYLPHHGVLRAESTTTKLRVVFNASYKSKNNNSLNDLMYTGPNLQKDMLTLLVNWRVHKYVFTADVEKMYRCIWLNEDQQHLQTIFWRDSPQHPLEEWQLCTVTYGTKSAPYLAMRTLHQLAKDEGDSYPEAGRVLQNYFYMDDLVYGHDDVQSAKKLVTDLIELMKKGGFNLRKWTSNNPSILENLQDDQKSKTSNINFNPGQTSDTKTLGMRWNPIADTFTFDWQLPEMKKLTKRIFLGEISKLYDPLGWLSPTTIKAKLLFQKVWLSKIEWDECLPEEVAAEWESIRKDLPNINKLVIPRWLHCTEQNIELHGFCDASEKAYACVIYSRVKQENGDYVTTLIAAKTKVAPLSKKLTLPRMELCGALILSKLIQKIKATITGKSLEIYCWSDSKVVLAWLQGNVNKWERYISNRVSQINNIIPPTQWRYVKSEENAADCATRGLSPSKLLTFKLWWEGPEWLKTSDCKITNLKQAMYTTSNGSKTNCYTAKSENDYNIMTELINKHSNLNRVIRVVAWIQQAIRVFRNKNKKVEVYKIKPENFSLSPQQLSEAMELIIKNVQQQHFKEDIERLKKGNNISTRSNLLKLTPFLDEKGVLRVRGRLENSTLTPEAKHPAILPATGRLTELIIQRAHRDTLHGGARLTLAQIRLKFWIIGGNRIVKKQLRQCVRCHRFKPHRNTQIMADLPKERVTPSKPFSNTGVDFTGHVDVKINKGRGIKTCKAYIAIFICMVTKAVHLELVSDLTTQTFLAAFKRMCARRGTPKHIYSDNGTNFVGAAKVLHDDFIRNKTFLSSEFHDEMSYLQVEWHFNAPYWPTAGGLWEAAVKSMKYHLKRVLGEQKLTFEQFSTLLTQIEACMNSRPLCSLSEDVDDLEYLSPGHFLVGGPLLAPPQEERECDHYDLRNRWRLVEQMSVHIWKRWSREYLHRLQERNKWQHPKKNLERGNLVLVKDENLPQGKWALGRITEVHPGTDGNVRVVTLKTKKGQVKRPISKLVPLPINKDVASNTSNDEIQKKSKQQTNTTGGGRSKYNLFSLLLMTLIFAVGTVSATQTNSFTVTPIENNHPMYFDEAGKLQLVHDEWALLIYFNLTSYWQATTKIHNYVDQIDDLCKCITYTPCETMVSHLRHELRHQTEYDTMLLSQHLTRQKRGYFNGVGELARTLFGVLDENFAVKYEKDIQNLQNNDDYLLQLIKNQTLIVEAENNIIKKSENFMETQFKALRDHLNKTYGEISKIENRIQAMYAVNDVHSAVITATLVLGDLQRIQDMLLNALADVYKGHLDTHLFPAEQLTEQLNIISGKLPQGLSLPVKDVKKDIQEIYEIVYVKARITNNYLLFEVHIPLLSEEEYSIYRAIPIPFMRQGSLKLVQSSSKYIAINFMKNSFITMEENDMQQCIKSNTDKYTCIARQPVYSLHDKNAPCEVNVLSQQTSLSCVVTNVDCKEAWIKLHKPNIWLFILCKKHLMRVICEDQITPVAINGTGIIALRPKCILQKKDATLFTYNHLGSKLHMEVNVDVPTVNSSINNLFDLNWNNALINFTEKKTFSDREFTKFDQQLTYQKEHEKLPVATNVSVHDIYHYTVTSLIFFGGLAVILYIWLKRRCSNKHRIKLTGQSERQEVNVEMQEIRHTAPPKPKRSFHFDD